MKYIYKYCPGNLFDIIFSDEGNFSIKFSKLEDFNDPYEYFLTINYDTTADKLATYQEMLTMQLTYLASCFSKSPVITPMWAHYADNFKGFVLEIDEENLINYLNEQKLSPKISNVEYSNHPSAYLDECLAYATIRCKFRDIYKFQSAILYHAYFIKQKCWKYEKEKRIILPERVFNNNNKLLWCPNKFIKSIVVGYKATENEKNYLKDLTQKYKINYYEIYPSKISLNPFLVDINSKTHKYTKNGIKPARYYCPICNEPIKKNQKLCAWCNVTETDKNEAHYRNSFIALARAGLLNKYINDMNRISEDIIKK